MICILNLLYFCSVSHTASCLWLQTVLTYILSNYHRESLLRTFELFCCFFSFVHAALSIKQTSAAVTIYILIFFFKLMLIHMQCHTPPLKLLPCYWNISLELTVMWYVAGWLVRSLCSTLKTRLSPLLKLMPVHTLAVRPLCKWAYILPKPIHWNVLICKLNYIL